MDHKLLESSRKADHLFYLTYIAGDRLPKQYLCLQGVINSDYEFQYSIEDMWRDILYRPLRQEDINTAACEDLLLSFSFLFQALSLVIVAFV